MGTWAAVLAARQQNREFTIYSVKQENTDVVIDVTGYHGEAVRIVQCLRSSGRGFAGHVGDPLPTAKNVFSDGDAGQWRVRVGNASDQDVNEALVEALGH